MLCAPGERNVSCEMISCILRIPQQTFGIKCSVHNCRLPGAVEISQIPLVPSFAADTLKNEQGMLVADVYIYALFKA